MAAPSASTSPSGWRPGTSHFRRLSDPALFATAALADPSTVAWDGDEDLAIDSLNLARLAEQQRATGPAAAAEGPALVESTAVALAGGPDAWARTGVVIQDQYRAMAAAAVRHVLEAAAAILHRQPDGAAAAETLRRLADAPPGRSA